MQIAECDAKSHVAQNIEASVFSRSWKLTKVSLAFYLSSVRVWGARTRVAPHNPGLHPLRNTVFYSTSDRHGKNTTKRDCRRCSRPTVITELYTQLRLLWTSVRRSRANIARTKRLQPASTALGGRGWSATAHPALHTRRTEDPLEKPSHPHSPFESASTAWLPKCTFPS